MPARTAELLRPPDAAPWREAAGVRTTSKPECSRPSVRPSVSRRAWLSMALLHPRAARTASRQGSLAANISTLLSRPCSCFFVLFRWDFTLRGWSGPDHQHVFCESISPAHGRVSDNSAAESARAVRRPHTRRNAASGQQDSAGRSRRARERRKRVRPEARSQPAGA